MEQLSALDTAFLNLETGSTPMHVGSLGIYDQSTVPGEKLGFKDIIRYFESRLPKVPALRSRMVDVPMGLDYPYWISDPDFDIEFHLRHIALPQPGDWRQLCIQVARLHARPLDMGRPPWEIYVIEGLDKIPGLPEGSFAIVSKVHHALVDGVFGAQLMAAMHDLGPNSKINLPDKPWIVDRVPTGVELLSRAAFNSVRNVMNKGKVLGRYALPAATNVVKKKLTGQSCNLFSAPKTRFNDRVSSHRVFEAVSFDLSEIKKVKNALPDITLNDVMVNIVAGALRRYLKSKGELPEESMTGMLPISVRPDAKQNQQGNQISFMFPKIYTDIDDTVERLKAIHKATAAGKDTNEQFGGGQALESAALLPTTVTNLVMRSLVKYNVTNYVKPLFNTVITNVPGPQLPLYHAGAKLVSFYGSGICYDTMGLFHILFSYNGNITISVTCCRNMMPDPAFYADCLRYSFKEMQKALLGEAKKTNVVTSIKKVSDKKVADTDTKIVKPAAIEAKVTEAKATTARSEKAATTKPVAEKKTTARKTVRKKSATTPSSAEKQPESVTEKETAKVKES
ncbi:wax ester/triacylglycerol synthase family O-acyltransferase [Kistimonas asteriae]|uniref:wax ester/triacylglycerol synthase family O-acyltransferase n=1 Tax=Kistimonas asteriae TaxID=517724 RepID=UPI001BA6A1BD|nr:wax ester/triacylglycerol synthase family O-acyltransferase [Kistimonas asteriae]